MAVSAIWHASIMAPLEVTSSAHLTILLPLKDRVPFTHRWLVVRGERATAVPHPDRRRRRRSTRSRRRSRRRNRRDWTSSTVRYPYDSTYADYYAKLADALSRVTTPFVVMADNDDFFIPQRPGARASNSCRRTPITWPAAANARCSGSRGAGASARPTPSMATRVEWKCSSQLSSDVADTAGQRLLERCLGANDVFYAVHRTESAATVTSKPCATAIRSDLFLMEQLIMFLTAIAGKTRQLDTLYIARQQDSPGSSGGAHQERFGDWYDRMLLPTWSDDFTRFVDCCDRGAGARRRHLQTRTPGAPSSSPTRCRWRRRCSPTCSKSRPSRCRCRWCCRWCGSWSACRARAVLRRAAQRCYRRTQLAVARLRARHRIPDQARARSGAANSRRCGSS